MQSTAQPRRLVGAFVNTHPAQCSIYESGAMVQGCLTGSPLFDLHCVTLADIDLDVLRRSHRLVSRPGTAPRDFPAQFDFWVFNWHFITMAGHIDPATIAALPGLKFTVVLELAEDDPLVLVPKNVFDGYLALDPLVPQRDGVFPFPRPLQGTAMQGVVHGRSVPVIGSFGFGTPGKGFELLTEAVNREFDAAILRINVPIGDYISSRPGLARDYADQMARNCRRIARRGIEVQFSNDFRSPEAVIDWCHENDLNCFMYTRDQPGLSATTDQAILSGQPLLTLTNATFRHIHPYIPPYPLTTLRQAMERSGPAVAAMQRDWSKAQFRARFESMLAAFGAALPAGSGLGAGTRAAADNPRVRVLVLHRRDGSTGDLLSHGTRFVNALSRPATRDIRKVVCDTLPEALAAIIEQQPDTVIVLDHGSEWFAQLAGCWNASTRPFRLLDGSSEQPALALDAGPRPIVPFFTHGIPAPVTSVAWLLGFEPDDGHLYRWLARIASETRIGRVVVEAVGADKPALTAQVARSGPLKRADGSVVAVEVHSLPERALDIVTQHLANESVVICHAGAGNLARTEALCALALSSERAVILDPLAPLPSFDPALCLGDDQSLQERIDLGFAGQIAVVCDAGEWGATARWLPRIDRQDDDAAALPASDLASAVVLSGLDELDDADFVRGLGVALLGHEIDDDALDNHLDALWDGRTRSDVAAAIAHSPPALARLATGAAPPGADLLQACLHGWLARLAELDNGTFVRAAYWAGLGRDADAGGLDGHRALIDNGETRLFVLHAIVGSPEAQSHARHAAAGRAALPTDDELAGMAGAAWIRRLAQADAASFRDLAARFFLGRAPRPGELGDAATATPRDRFQAIEALRQSAEGVAWAAAVLGSVAARRLAAFTAAAASPRQRRQTAGRSSAASLQDRAPLRPLPVLPPPGRAQPVVWVVAGTDETAAPGLFARLLAMQACGPAYALGWNASARRFEALADGAQPSGEFLPPQHCRPGDWLILPGGFGPRAGDLPEVDVFMTARALGLRSAALFLGADALAQADATGTPEAQACERHAQALLLADVVLPVSNAARDDITDLFAEHLLAHDAPPIVKLPLPLLRDDAAAWDGHARKLRALLLRLDHARDSVQSVVVIDLRGDAAGPALAPLLRDRGVAVSSAALHGDAVVVADASQTAADTATWLVVDGTLPASAVAAVRDFAAARHLRIAALSPAAGPAHDFAPYLDFDRVIVATEVEHQALQAQLLATRRRLPDAEQRFVRVDRRGVAGTGPRPRIGAGVRRDRRRFNVVAAPDVTAAQLTALQAGFDRATALGLLFDTVVVHADGGSRDVPSGWAAVDSLDAALRESDAVWVLGDAALAAQAADAAGWLGVPAIVDAGAGLAPTPGVVAVAMAASDDVAGVAQRLLTDSLWRDALRTDALLRTPRTADDHAGDVLRLLAQASVFRALAAVQPSGRGAIADRLPALRRRPLLSVCISTYNRAGWLGVNLRNLFEQLGPVPDPDVEIVVVDNAATDSTPQVVEPYLGRPDFRYHRNPVNVGMLGNLAVTAQRSTGSYVWVIGDDDLTQPDAVPKILAALKAHPGLAMVYLNYGYTSAADPAAIGDLAAHLASFNVLEPAGPDALSTVAGLAAKSENFYTAIYACVFERSHALRAFCLDTSGRPFSTLLTCVPTAYYALHHMSALPAYWIGNPVLVVNSNVSWAPYGPLFDLEQLPRTWDLAEVQGAPAAAVDVRRSSRLWLVEMMWRDIFENDAANNSPYFSAARVLTRLKHLRAIDERIPQLLAIYRRAHANGHPAATLAPEVLFAAWPEAAAANTAS